MEIQEDTPSAEDVQDFTSGVKLLVLNLPEDEGEGLGFRLTRTLWDPYPWVREVSPGSRAATAGLRPGHCLLQADGKDLLGLPVGTVARVIRGDGAGRGVSLLAWHCGRDPTTDPELLWSCGGGLAGERSRRALEGVLRALACCVCAATATAPRSCRRDHLYCTGCWSRLERCALCREPLPPHDSPVARNLVAEQVFEAIATEYEIKDVKKRPTESTSAYTSPNRSPNMSPHMSGNRRGQYQLSLMSRKKHVQFNDKNRNYASDPNLHRSSEKVPVSTQKVPIFNQKLPDLEHNVPSNSKCSCQRVIEKVTCNFSDATGRCQCQKAANNKNSACSKDELPRINIEESDSSSSIPHRLVTRLRPACSLADLPSCVVTACQLSRSLNDLQQPCKVHGSLENIKSKSNNTLCGCWSRLERCALCREPLPPHDSPVARNLVAEQVFEAIATEYEIKDVKKRPTESTSAYTSPNRSPNMSPHMSGNRRGQYQLSLMSRKKHVQFNDKNRNYASDPNLHRSSEKVPVSTQKVPIFNQKLPDLEHNVPSNSKCSCQRVIEKVTCNFSDATGRCQCQKAANNKNSACSKDELPRINIEESDSSSSIPHRLVTRLRPACSLADLPSCVVTACQLSRSLNDLQQPCKVHGSLENIKSKSNNTLCEPPVFVVSAPPVYVLTCGHHAPE